MSEPPPGAGQSPSAANDGTGHDEPGQQDSAPDRRTVQRLRIAAVIAVSEAVVAAGGAVVELVNAGDQHLTVGITTALFFLLYAAGLAWVARGLARLRSWSRGPVVLAQLIQLGVGWDFRGGSTNWVVALFVVPALIAIAIIFSPASTEALYGKRMSGFEEPP